MSPGSGESSKYVARMTSLGTFAAQARLYACMTVLRWFPSFELRLLTRHPDACYTQDLLIGPADLVNLGDSNRTTKSTSWTTACL